jgi:hypothetical protein
MTTHKKANIAALLPVTVLCSSLLLTNSDAALTAYEPFDYVAGSLTGQSGGTGWNAGWTVSGTGGTVSSPGLSYVDGNSTGLAVAGNKADWVSNNNGNFRLPTSTPDANGTTLYLSFLAQLTTSTGYAGLSLFQGVTENLFLGAPNTRTFWGIDPKAGGSGVAVSTTPTTTLSLLVYRIDFAATTTISLYVNPTLGIEPATPAITATRPSFTWDTIRIQSGNGSVGAIDEIRIGTDYGSVAPIPEPSAIAAIFGGLGILLMRRRH